MKTKSVLKEIGKHFYYCKSNLHQLEVIDIVTNDVSELNDKFTEKIKAEQLDFISVADDYCFVTDQNGFFKGLPTYYIEAHVNGNKENFYIYGSFLIGKNIVRFCPVAQADIISVVGFDSYNEMNEFFEKHELSIYPISV